MGSVIQQYLESCALPILGRLSCAKTGSANLKFEGHGKKDAGYATDPKAGQKEILQPKRFHNIQLENTKKQH